VGCLFIYLVICIVVLCVWIKWLDFFLFSLFLFLGRYKGRGWGGGEFSLCFCGLGHTQCHELARCLLQLLGFVCHCGPPQDSLGAYEWNYHSGSRAY
jgi:hypothetical protein